MFAGKQLNTDLELTNSEQAVCSGKFEVEAECKKFKGLGLVDILQHFAKVSLLPHTLSLTKNYHCPLLQLSNAKGKLSVPF